MHGDVAQLARASGSYPAGRKFESHRRYHYPVILTGFFIFKKSWYFRNSLVRANYKNFAKNIFEDTSYLEKFFYNLLANTNFELKNRYTHIDYIQENNEEIKTENYTLEEHAIINILKENSKVKQEEIAKQIGKLLRTVKSRMIEIQEKGLIERKNGKRDGEWIINVNS